MSTELWWMCHRKRPYPTKAEAQARIWFKDMDELHPYCCPYCQKWHIGHEKVAMK